MSNAPRITERPDDAFSAPARPSRVKTWRRGGARPPGLAEAAAEFLPKPWVDLGAQRINAQDIEDVARFAGPDIGSPLAAPANRVLKRAADLVIGAAALVLLAPLMGLIWALLRIEGGPALYVQSRVGQGGARFRCLKFRTMRKDAEADGVARWATEDDPRITRCGGFLRKYRFDELPQFVNVIRGDMSFVGPRPERPYFVETLARQIPFYQERHCVRPGITGWAQLNYPYGASMEDAKHKLQYDLFYIKYFSIVFDLAIVLQTVRVVLWPTGAR